jgi:hypothetical protein
VAVFHIFLGLPFIASNFKAVPPLVFCRIILPTYSYLIGFLFSTGLKGRRLANTGAPANGAILTRPAAYSTPSRAFGDEVMSFHRS